MGIAQFWPPVWHRKRLFVDSSAMNAALGGLIIASLRLNAEMWLHDYPPDIRATFGEKSAVAERQSRLLAVPFFGILIGAVIWSNGRLRQENDGRLPLHTAFWHTYSLFAAFWLFDLTILDWLFFVRLKPDFVVLPGTEGLAGYDDYAFHLRVALPALPLMALPALLIALLMQRE